MTSDQASMMPQPAKRRRPAWLIPVVVLGVLVVAGATFGVVRYLGSRTITVHRTITPVHGTITLLQGQFATVHSHAGTQCQGDGPYSDISEFAQVTVAGPDGTVLALATLPSGRAARAFECIFEFTVEVPAGRGIYAFDLGNRGRVRYTEDQIRNTSVDTGVTWSGLFVAAPTAPTISATRTIVLDDGALTIEPVDAVTPAYDEAYARAAAAQVIWPVIGPTTRVILARVSSNLAPGPGSYDGKTVIPRSWSLAWVLLSTEQPQQTMCLEVWGYPPATWPGTAAVLVDATSGVVSAYLPYHDFCGHRLETRLDGAWAMYSVPFQVDPHGTFTLQLPPCSGKLPGIDQGVDPRATYLNDQIVPLASGAVQFTAAVRIGPCHAPATTYRVKVPWLKAPYGHAPTGQLRRTPDGVVIVP